MYGRAASSVRGREGRRQREPAYVRRMARISACSLAQRDVETMASLRLRNPDTRASGACRSQFSSCVGPAPHARRSHTAHATPPHGVAAHGTVHHRRAPFLSRARTREADDARPTKPSYALPLPSRRRQQRGGDAVPDAPHARGAGQRGCGTACAQPPPPQSRPPRQHAPSAIRQVCTVCLISTFVPAVEPALRVVGGGRAALGRRACDRFAR